MSNKKILISMPFSLLYELDRERAKEKLSRSEFVRKAVKEALLSRRNEALEKGYVAMGELNLSLAEEGITADNEQLLTYEQKLSESE